MNKHNDRAKFFVVVALLFCPFFILKLPWLVSAGPGPNNFNFSATTAVNITNSFPEIILINCNEGSNITLAAGTELNLTCKVEVRDFDGGSTVNLTNATFYYYPTGDANDPDDNNTHYTNSSCTRTNTASFFANFTCRFDVLFFANNGTWTFNITTQDDFFNFTSYNITNLTVLPLFAINVTELVDYGQMAVGDTSATSEIVNVTNFGNRPVNVSIYGFGGNTTGQGGGMAMNCTQRNISITNERYSVNASESSYFTMEYLSNTPALINDYQLAKQTVNDNYIVNNTFWRLHVNATTSPGGFCNGTLVFSSVAP